MSPKKKQKKSLVLVSSGRSGRVFMCVLVTHDLIKSPLHWGNCRVQRESADCY